MLGTKPVRPLCDGVSVPTIVMIRVLHETVNWSSGTVLQSSSATAQHD